MKSYVFTAKNDIWTNSRFYWYAQSICWIWIQPWQYHSAVLFWPQLETWRVCTSCCQCSLSKFHRWVCIIASERFLLSVTPCSLKCIEPDGKECALFFSRLDYYLGITDWASGMQPVLIQIVEGQNKTVSNLGQVYVEHTFYRHWNLSCRIPFKFGADFNILFDFFKVFLYWSSFILMDSVPSLICYQ